VANGAVASLMSGSGATVFGIFEQYDLAHKSKQGFLERYSTVYMAKPIEKRASHNTNITNVI